MDRPMCRIPHIAALTAVTAILVTASCSIAVAQTLTNPNPQTKWATPPAKDKAPPARLKSCSAFGAGFVNVPGTEACVKVGGFVSVEVGR